MSIKLPEPIKISKRIANELDELERKGETIVRVCGQANIEALFYLYLIKKYKSNCVANKIGKLRRDSTMLGVSIDIKKKLTKEESAEMREDLVNLAKTLTKCIKKGEKTIIIPLYYYKGVSLLGHANMLIYRRTTNVVEHFEPHGGEFKGDKNSQENIEKIMNLFIRFFNDELKKERLPEVTYIEASNVCPYLYGLQTIEERSQLKRSKDEPGGYCSIWSMFFAELCLKNPDKSSKELLENIYIYLKTKDSAFNYLKKIIRGYSGYVVEAVNAYLKIFFKPTYTITDVIDFSKNFNLSKIYKMRNAIQLLVELESEVLLDDDYDLEAELRRVKKLYNKAIKGMTLEQEKEARHKNKAVQPLYYRKRILQNYDEYSNYGKISEPIADSPLELMEDKLTEHPVLIRRQKTQKETEALPAPKGKAKTQRRRMTKEEKDQSFKTVMDLLAKQREEKK
jgi:hypothetical protein